MERLQACTRNMVKKCSDYLIDDFHHQTTMGPIYSFNTEWQHKLQLTFCMLPLSIEWPIGLPPTG
jgi:hypothetical protein